MKGWHTGRYGAHPGWCRLLRQLGHRFFLQYTFRGFYGSGVEAYPDFPLFKGDMVIADLMLFLAMVIVAVLGALALIPVYRYFKKLFIPYPKLSWFPFIISALILIAVGIFIVPVLHNLFTSIVNTAIPLSPEVAAEQEVAATAQVTIPISKMQFVVIVSSILLMVGLYSFVQKTKIGKAMRAVAEDKEVAALMGIDVDRVITTTFAVGAALAGSSRYCLCPYVSSG